MSSNYYVISKLAANIKLVLSHVFYYHSHSKQCLTKNSTSYIILYPLLCTTDHDGTHYSINSAHFYSMTFIEITKSIPKNLKEL